MGRLCLDRATVKRTQNKKRKVALVTGAAKRIGRACALALAEGGMDVIIHYCSSGRDADKTADLVRAQGCRAWTLQGALDNPNDATELFAEARRLTSRPIDILINSASIYEPGPLVDTTQAELTRNLNINALSPFILSQAFAAQTTRGVAINFLDARIVTLNNDYAAYHLSKTLLATMTRMLALHYAPGIRFNAIAPGVILPPPGKPRSYALTAAQANPMKRMGSTADIVHALRYLIDAPFVTGQILFVDGGYHLKGNAHA